MDQSFEIPSLNLEDISSGENDLSLTETMAITKEEENAQRKLKAVDDDNHYKDRIRRHTEREKEIERELILDHYHNRHERDDMESVNELIKDLEDLTFFKMTNNESTSTNTSSSSSFDDDTLQKSKMIAESRLERHHTVACENCKVKGNMDTIYKTDRSCQQDSETTSQQYSRKPITVCVFEDLEKEKQRISQPNKNMEHDCGKLKKELFVERQLHAKDNERFKKILFSIDKALSTLPIRIGRIRLKNRKNLSRMNTGLDCGDFEVTISDHPQNVEEISYCNHSDKKIKTLFVSNVASEVAQENPVSKKVQDLLLKTDKLNDLVKCLQQAESTPIEVLVNNELFAISLLKNEIRGAKQEIEESKPDTESLASTEEKPSDCQSDKFSSVDINTSDDPNIQVYEKHIYLQEEALALLTNKIQKTEELLVREVQANEDLKKDKETLSNEVKRLKVIEEKCKEECQKFEKFKTDPDFLKSGSRPFRTIKELKAQLEEKDKNIALWKSKFTRSEAVQANKTNLLENEKKKNLELENKIKNLNSRIKLSATQITSLQYLNTQLKEQMELLKNQMNNLTYEKHDKPEKSGVTKSEIGEHFIELAEILKNQDVRVRTLREEADNKLREVEKLHSEEMNLAKRSLEKSEKINSEYLNTIKALLRSVHEFAIEKDIKSINKPSYSRVREILGISRNELDLLFSVYAKNSNREELDQWYEECLSLIESNEFSEKLSSWLFHVIRKKIENVAKIESETEKSNENEKENEIY